MVFLEFGKHCMTKRHISQTVASTSHTHLPNKCRSNFGIKLRHLKTSGRDDFLSMCLNSDLLFVCVFCCCVCSQSHEAVSEFKLNCIKINFQTKAKMKKTQNKQKKKPEGNVKNVFCRSESETVCESGGV